MSATHQETCRIRIRIDRDDDVSAPYTPFQKWRRCSDGSWVLADTSSTPSTDDVILDVSYQEGIRDVAGELKKWWDKLHGLK